MKTTLLLTLVFSALISNANAGGFIGRVDHYIETRTGNVVEISSNDIEKDGTASFFDYSIHAKRTVNINDYSKNTRMEIAGVKAGEKILARTLKQNSNSETVSRYCEVFYLFENKMAYVGCKATEADRINGYALPNRFDFIVNNVENVTAEVSELDGFKKGEVAELRINTKSAKALERLKILVIFANGEVLAQKAGLNVLDTSGILYKHGAVERIHLSDLNKI